MRRSVVLCLTLVLCVVSLHCAHQRKEVDATAALGTPELSDARQMMAQGQWEAAARLLSAFLKDHPESVEARNGLGLSYLETGRVDDAIPLFDAVLRDVPGQPYAVLYLGLCHLKKADFTRTLLMWQGYENTAIPEVTAEIKRRLTLLLIKQNRMDAQKMLAMEAQLMAAAPDPDTIGVSYFRDLSPDASLQPFQKALAAMITTALTKIESLRVVERLRLQALLEEMALGQMGIVDPDTAPRVGKLLRADRMVTGSLSLGSIEIVASVVSASRGGVEGTESMRLERDDFFNAPGLVVMNVAKIAGIRLSPLEIQAIGVPQTTSTQAMEHFGAALMAMDTGNWSGAMALMQAAVAADPGFSTAIRMSDTIPPADAPTVEQIAVMAPVRVAEMVADPVEKAIGGVSSDVIEQQMRTVTVEPADQTGQATGGAVSDLVGGGGSDPKLDVIEAWEEAIVPSRQTTLPGGASVSVTPVLNTESATAAAAAVAEDNQGSTGADGELPGFPGTP